jgi:hypothetical protein
MNPSKSSQQPALFVACDSYLFRVYGCVDHKTVLIAKKGAVAPTEVQIDREIVI